MRASLVVASTLFCSACGGSGTLPAVSPAEPAPIAVTDRHVVTVVGTPWLDESEAVARWHDTLRPILDRSDADVVFVDVASERIERLRAAIIDPATAAEADFVTVVEPWANTHGVEVVAVGAWSDVALRDLFDYQRRFPHGPLEREALARRAMFMGALIEHAGGLDVAWLNSDEFVELSGDAERWTAFYGEQERGEAGIFRIAARTLASMDDALAAMPPCRVLVLVPATARFFVESGLEVLDDVVLIGPHRLF